MQQQTQDSKRKVWFWTSVCVNLGFLGVFKYYDFFISSFADLLDNFGISWDPYTLQLILPVGISFYTFHGLSYIIDVYNRKIEAEQKWIVYAVFVSFFPLLVAGPIERATHLLPQIKRYRIFDTNLALHGLKQILWGLFKKVVIADNCAEIANQVFVNAAAADSLTLAFGAIMFAFQIYGDFSGYSDIAIGAAKLFGIRLLKNFSFPYLSRDIAEFWRRWHISLSTWFRDYIYYPLGGSRMGKWLSIRNTFIIFLLSGFWHGANWTFIFWGLLNALFFLPLLLIGKNRKNVQIIASNKNLPTLKELLQILNTFVLVTIAWIFFRAPSMSEAAIYLERMFTVVKWQKPEVFNWTIVFFIQLLMLVEFIGRKSEFGFDGVLSLLPKPLRYLTYYSLIVLIFIFAGKEQQFIYFQF